MAKLIYTAIASLDGYVEDDQGAFDWAAPDEEVHTFVNDLERPIGTYLYGRRMYDTMRFWQTTDPDDPPFSQDFARIWQAADKIVFSRTLASVTTPRTRIEHEFDPAAVRRLKAGATSDLTIGGAGLAAQAVAAGLVDEFHLLAVPVIVGGGKRWLPEGVRHQLELLDTRRFDGGVVFLRYRDRS